MSYSECSVVPSVMSWQTTMLKKLTVMLGCMKCYELANKVSVILWSYHQRSYHQRSYHQRRYKTFCVCYQGRVVWRGCRAAALPEKFKAKDSAKRPKSGFSCEISQHNHFRYFRHHFGSTFPRNPTKPMFRSLPTTPLVR